MKAAVSDAKLAELAKVLQDFGRAPGNYPVRRGEPRQLHAQLDILASWALGRVPTGYQTRAKELQAAAVMFVQRACFAPDNTHYQVFGLASENLTPETLRTRYRALIRLTHPDMGVEGLPGNAAGVVNRAHEVLRDPELRRRYDDQLSQRAVVVSYDRDPPLVRRIELREGWSDRWQSLVARFPRMVPFGLAAGGFGLVGLGCAIIWASFETQESRLLIVSSVRDEAPQNKLEPHTRTVQSRLATSAAAASANTSLGVASTNQEPASAPSSGSSYWHNLWKFSPQPERQVAAMNSELRSGVTPGQTSAEFKSRIKSEDTATVFTPFIPLPLTKSVRVSEAADARPLSIASGQSQQMTTGDAAQPVFTQIQPQRQLPAAEPLQSSDQQITRTVVEVQAPAPSPPTSTWSIDANGAKHYLTNLISGLERPSNARKTNAYLVDMKVQGSLLQPALSVIRQYRDINVEQMTWTDSQRPGVMKVQGMVVLMLKGASSDDNKRVNFQLSAEFWGTRNGTVLSSLSLKESD